MGRPPQKKLRTADASGLVPSPILAFTLMAGAGGTLTQLITDFGHTRDLVATNKLQQKAQDKTTIATQQDVMMATDTAFYRLLNAQSLLRGRRKLRWRLELTRRTLPLLLQKVR